MDIKVLEFHPYVYNHSPDRLYEIAWVQDGRGNNIFSYLMLTPHDKDDFNFYQLIIAGMLVNKQFTLRSEAIEYCNEHFQQFIKTYVQANVATIHKERLNECA